MHLLKVFFILSIIGNCNAQVHLDHELRTTIESDPQRDLSVILIFKPAKAGVSLQSSDLSVQNRKIRLMKQSQAAFLTDTAKLGLFKNRTVKSMWINNSIIMKLKGSEILKLTNRDDIESIILDKTVYLNEPVVSENNQIDVE